MHSISRGHHYAIFFLQLITPSGLELKGEAGAADEINGISDIQNP